MVDTAGGQADHVGQALEQGGTGTQLDQSGEGPFQDLRDEKACSLMGVDQTTPALTRRCRA
jgi:hypothetical protein